MCETSVNLPRFLSMYSRRSSKLWFSLFSSVPEILKVTKRLANSSVRTVLGISIITSRLSTTRNLTCRGLPSGVQKIVVMKCSPCREGGVHLQRMSALECVLLSQGRFKVISMAFTQIESDVWVVQMVGYMLTVLVEGGFLTRLSMNVKFVDSGGQEKVISQVSSFFVSIL